MRTESLSPRAVALVLAALLALGGTAVAARWCLEFGLAWRCPALLLAGVPCPSCGSTRALAALAQFDFLAAFRFNPLVVTALAALAVAPLIRYWRIDWGKRGWFFFGAALLLNWIYLLLFLPR